MRNLSQRKSIRLKSYDYSTSGYYFVTICTYDRMCLFGDIENGKMKLNGIGKIINNVWESLPKHHSVELNTFQIMPNHMHFILIIPSCRRGIACNARFNGNARSHNTGFARKTPTFGNVTAGSLPCIIRSFKSECTKQIRRASENHYAIWQRNYHEHIIRTENNMIKIQKYIKNNPQMWDRDRNNPQNIL